jgi:hypothetical protein
MPPTSSVDTNITAAISVQTMPGLPSRSSTPVKAGPTKMLRFSIVPETALAATSSDGLRASSGRSAPWAGRVNVTLMAASVART